MRRWRATIARSRCGRTMPTRSTIAAITLHELKRYEEALASYDRRARRAAGLCRGAQQSRQCPAGAEAVRRGAGKLRPGARVAAGLCRGALQSRHTLHELHRFDEALASYDRLLAVSADHPNALNGAADCAMKLCDWDRRTRLAADVNEHVAGKKSIISPFVLLGYSDDPALQLQCVRNYIEDLIPVSPPPFWSGQKWRNDKLRVAYVSADFRSHVIAFLMAELFEQHDRSRFDIIGVSFGIDDRSEMRKRLIAAFDEFHDVRLQSDEEVARFLNEQHIDIAVDLNGYTRDSRPGIFAHRPVPIQVNYLGFPATMGADFIDYIIADAMVLPCRPAALLY